MRKRIAWLALISVGLLMMMHAGCQDETLEEALGPPVGPAELGIPVEHANVWQVFPEAERWIIEHYDCDFADFTEFTDSWMMSCLALSGGGPTIIGCNIFGVHSPPRTVSC